MPRLLLTSKLSAKQYSWLVYTANSHLIGETMGSVSFRLYENRSLEAIRMNAPTMPDFVAVQRAQKSLTMAGNVDYAMASVPLPLSLYTTAVPFPFATEPLKTTTEH